LLGRHLNPKLEADLIRVVFVKSVQTASRQLVIWALAVMSDHRTLALTLRQIAMMEDQRPTGQRADFVRALARESGAPEQQINDIVSLVGFDRPSVLREARILLKAK
jgi:hypothetical protein